MRLSPFTPLFFIDRKSDGIKSKYTQVFSSKDQIFLQIICRTGEETGDWMLYSEPGHILLDYIDYSYWNMNEDTEVHFAILSPASGLYSVEVGGKTSEVFRVTDDPLILENTTLIQYSMKDNRQRNDGVFFIDGMQQFFDFRVPGGFKDNNWSFAVEGEQFITDEADIVQLYCLDSTQKKFTLGNSEGCPVWFAELLNRLLCCTYVYFDGERYARKDTSVPEMTVLIDGINSFVFTQNLQKVVNIDPILTLRHQALMRRTDNTNYRLSTININRLIK